MNTVLQVFLIACLLVFLVIILAFLTKKHLNLKYTLIWLLADLFMLVVAIFPGIVDWLGSVFGIASPVNTVFLFAGMFSLLIILTLTMIVSHMNNRIYRIVQAQAILEKRVRDLEGK